MSVAAAVEEKIASKKVVVYSKTTCPYCFKAKKALAPFIKKGILKKEDYEVINIGGDPKCQAIQSYMLRKTGAKSVPRVFINGKCIGGGDETVQKAASGELEELLKQ